MGAYPHQLTREFGGASVISFPTRGFTNPPWPQTYFGEPSAAKTLWYLEKLNLQYTMLF